MGRDWLGEDNADDWMEPEERYVGVIEAEFNARKAEAQALVADVARTDVVPAVKADIELPVDPKKQSELLTECWARLEQRQQVYLKTLKQCGWNVRKTVRMLEGTPDAVSRTTVNMRWPDNDDFAFVLKVMTATAVGDVVKRERLLLRADEIAEEALEPKPILHKGLPTGFYENQPDTALRANEQLMKATGLLRDAQQSTRVTVRLVNLAGPEHEAIEGEAEVVE
jgi:hypothetical protein